MYSCRGLTRTTTSMLRKCLSRKCTTERAPGSKFPSNRDGSTRAYETGTALTVKSMGVGMGAGLLGSLVGMGGGFVAIPALTGWLRLTQHQAHGTSLGAVFATGAAGSSAYALSGHVDYEAAAAMAVAGMLASHMGARATTGISASSLKLALGVLMITVAPLLPMRDRLSREEDKGSPGGKISVSAEETMTSTGKHISVDDPKSSSSSSVVRDVKEMVLRGTKEGAVQGQGAGGETDLNWWEKLPRMFAIGLGSGFLAGVFGIGGGVVTVPAITLATDLGHKEVLGTSLAAMVLPALTGSVTHFRQGNLLPRIALPLAIGTGLGAFLGGNYAARHLDEGALKWGFSAVMVVLGARTISGARAAAPVTVKRST